MSRRRSVSHVAIQIAQVWGANVFATDSARSEGTIEAQRAVFIDRSEPAANYVARLTGRDGFDWVYETAGDVALDGTFLPIGAAPENVRLRRHRPSRA